MSKDKYPNIFLRQMVAVVFIILQIFFATRALLKIGEYILLDVFVCSVAVYFYELCRILRSRASQNTNDE